MKRSRGALLCVAAAALLVPHLAWAQKKGGKPAAAPAAPAAAPAAPAAAPAPGNDIEIDDPNAPKPAGGDQPGAPAGGDQPGAAAPGAAGGICEIDPSACPKGTDLKTAAERTIKADVYAVQQIYALRYHRVEINPFYAFTLNDQFVSHNGPGLAINYFITNVLAVGVNGNFYHGQNVDSDFNFQNRRATRIAVPLNEYSWNANLNFTYVPIYGKFAGFSNFIFHYDAYIVGGIGAISTRPIAVIDPDNRTFSYEPKVAFNAGIGFRVFLNRWFAATLEVRDYVYNEKLESLTVPTSQEAQKDEANWFGENQLTNNVQAQLGISIFLPFSWEYRLPK